MVKIMAVDDEDDISNLIKRVLEKDGYKVVICSSGEEALEKYPNEKPDLVLLDVMMGGMDGWETCKNIRKINKDQKILFLTATTVTGSARETMLKVGAKYLTKPFEPYELTERVKVALEEGTEEG